jgi:hypothetical protein
MPHLREGRNLLFSNSCWVKLYEIAQFYSFFVLYVAFLFFKLTVMVQIFCLYQKKNINILNFNSSYLKLTEVLLT